MATIDPCTLVMTSAAKHRRSVATEPGPFELLEFVMDEKTKAEVERAAELLHARMDNYVCKLVTFDKFGRADIVDRLQSHPDAFVQMAIQVAALKTHGRWVLGRTLNPLQNRMPYLDTIGLFISQSIFCIYLVF